MADSGWVKMHRGWTDHPIFTQKEFCQRMAWYWLIDNACWKPTRARCGSKIIQLERGQLTYSIRFLAEAWGWETTRVWRFLNALQSETMIATQSATGQLLITICNYSKYQLQDEIMQQQQQREPQQECNTDATNKKNLRTEEERKELFDSPMPPLKDEADVKPKRIRKCKPTSFIAEDFRPDFKQLTVASDLGLDADAETRRFIDHYLANGKPMADWQAAFRTWLDNSAKFSRERAARNANGRSGTQDVTGATLRVIAAHHTG
jgi:hypothetical protein